MQKYRIFLSNRVVTIGEPEGWIPAAGQVVLKEPRMVKLHHWLWKLEWDTKIKALFVHTPQPEVFFGDFVASMNVVRAAGGVVVRDGKAMFIYRHDRWDLPKGKMEAGESIRETAVREVEEECGVGGLEIDCPFKDSWHIYNMDGHLMLKQTSWFGMFTRFTGNPRPQLEEGIQRVDWFAPSEWAQEIFPYTFASLLPLLEEAEQWMLQNAGVDGEFNNSDALLSPP